MPLIINTNISSLVAMNALNNNSNALNKSLERLSTGFRINSAKDDAANSCISTSLGVQISAYGIAQNNAKTGIAMLDTADGALGNISDLLLRARDLALKSSNEIYSSDERNALQNEAENIVSEIYRIKSSTLFNSKSIFGSEKVKPLSEKEAIEQGYSIVKTAAELKSALKTNDADCKVMLFADINLDDLELDETGSNWTAIGTEANSFKGTFDGNGFTISNLKINKTDTNYQGLFGYMDNSTIKNVHLDNVDVKGKDQVGGLVGRNYNDSKIENCTSSGNVEGDNYTGGLAGTNSTNSTISNCTSSGNVVGNDCAGGLVGLNYTNSTIENCSSSGTVKGNIDTGGLVGSNYIYSIIQNCTSSGNVEGNNRTGGLVGANSSNSTISNCTSSGNVEGDNQTGGLVGRNYSSTISNSKTTSTVTGNTNTGAFLGSLESGTIEGNEYNSSINDGMKAVGTGLDNQTEEQIKDNTELNIEAGSVNNIGTNVNLNNIQSMQGNTTTIKSNTKTRFQIGIDGDKSSAIEIDTGLDLDFNINISTKYGAVKALDTIDKVLNIVLDKQSEFGAVSNKLDSIIESQLNQTTSLYQAKSIIHDTDFAYESANYVKSQILQEATASILATANQIPSVALTLINAGRKVA